MILKSHLYGCYESLLSSSAKSIFSDAHPKKGFDKIAVHQLITVSKSDQFSSNSLINTLIVNKEFKISFDTLNKEFFYNKGIKRIKNLYRKNYELIQDTGSDKLGIGYPLLRVFDPKRKKYKFLPILIFKAYLTKDSSNPNIINLSKEGKPEIFFNPILCDFIKDNFNREFVNPLTRYKTNYHYNFYNIINLISNSCNIEFIDEFFSNKTVLPFDEIFRNKIDEPCPELINNAVIGIYNNSKSSIISDYKLILNSDEYSSILSKTINNSKSAFFSGLNLDHSQQKVIKSFASNNDVVIHGPPGTGKSKTLTGVITYALSQSKSILVVCEKKTAMEVLKSNLKELGLENYCTIINDVRANRRSIVNKVRSFISNYSSKTHNSLFNQNFKNSSSVIENLEILVSKVQSIVEEINTNKNKLDEVILDPGITFSELVLKNCIYNNNFTDKYDDLKNVFFFNSKELNGILEVFNSTSNFLLKSPNPYNFGYESINFEYISNFDASEYQGKIDNLYNKYYDKLLKIKNDLESFIALSSKMQIKYYDFIENSDSELGVIFKLFRNLKNDILKSKLFNTDFFKKINSLDFVEQVIFLIESIKKTYLSRKNFYHLMEANAFISNHNIAYKRLIKCFCNSSTFKSDFLSWYYSETLKLYFVDNFNFNGNGSSKYDLVKEIKHINDLILAKIYSNLFTKRVNALKLFSKNYEDIKIERFFSKKSSKKKEKLSLRDISRHPSKILNSFFPVIITTPEVCSNLFPLQKDFFDVVIFDESSQLRVEDSIPALMRGKKRIVSGDTKQLPPPNFFSKARNIPFLKPSLLEFCVDQKFDEHYLDIHYRSKHPFLIEFSNHAFYNSRLIPIPPKYNYNPIEYYEFDGVFDSGINKIEAQFLLNYLVKFDDLKASIGIATFNVLQRDYILDLIDLKSKESFEFYSKMQIFRMNGFFVKNLENIQGEERDYIFISTTYGKSHSSKFKQSYGPINSKKKGHKLLNVIITRAKYKLIVLSSIPKKNILNGLKSLELNQINKGKDIFYGFLNYAKSISEEDEKSRETILKILKSNNSSVNKLDKKNDQKTLKTFSNYLITKIQLITGKELKYENDFSLGGFTYDILLFNSKFSILIDINGKVLHGDYEDYLYDIKRCEIAKNNNYRYYRLWASNLKNNSDQELNKLFDIIKK